MISLKTFVPETKTMGSSFMKVKAKYEKGKSLPLGS